MSGHPFTSLEDALLRMINAFGTARRAIDELAADTGVEPDEEVAEDLERCKADEQAAMAYLEANAAKCPGCKQAFAFQRQRQAPSKCSWCGYDHDTGHRPGLVPA